MTLWQQRWIRVGKRPEWVRWQLLDVLACYNLTLSPVAFFCPMYWYGTAGARTAPTAFRHREHLGAKSEVPFLPVHGIFLSSYYFCRQANFELHVGI